MQKINIDILHKLIYIIQNVFDKFLGIYIFIVLKYYCNCYICEWLYHVFLIKIN